MGQDIFTVKVVERCMWKTKIQSMGNIKRVLKELEYGDVNCLHEESLDFLTLVN
jgi:hypothetical protein